MPTSNNSLLSSAFSLVERIIPAYGTARRITAINFLNDRSSTACGGCIAAGALSAGSNLGIEIVCGPIPYL